MDEQAHDPVHLVGGATKVLTKMADAVMNGQAHDQTFEKIKRLGQGGFGVVWLCKATGSRVRFDASPLSQFCHDATAMLYQQTCRGCRGKQHWVLLCFHVSPLRQYSAEAAKIC